MPRRPTIWITVGQGPAALAVGAGGGGLDIFTLICPLSPLSPSFWETARYRLKYCLKRPLNPKQPTNQSDSETSVVQDCYGNFEVDFKPDVKPLVETITEDDKGRFGASVSNS